MTRAATGFALAAAGTLAVLLTGAFLAASGLLAEGGAGPAWPADALWKERGLDLAVQAFILLAGAFAILLLLRGDTGASPDG